MIRRNNAGFLFIGFLVFLSAAATAQGAAEKLIHTADSIAEILFTDAPDELKIKTDQDFESQIHDFLNQPASVAFTWDSIKFVKCLKPEDGRFALVTWVVPLADHRYHYAGFVQKLRGAKTVEVDTVYALNPNGEEIDLRKSYPSALWPAAVYQEILPKDKNTGFYTLLGWVGKPEGLSGKNIETLSFDTAGAPVFGMPAFSMKDGSMQNRVMFEYTSEIPFHLAYEQQRLPGKKRRNHPMIVFNRIGENTPGMGRMFRGPVPSYEFFDAFAMIGGKWVLFEDVKPVVNTRDLDDSRPKEIGLTPSGK